MDKPTYLASDVAKVTVTITNLSDTAAEGVHASGGGDLDVWGAWGDLGTKQGVRIAPHSTRTTTLSGRILNTTDDKVRFSAQVKAEGGDANPANNTTVAEASLIQAAGQFAGLIFTDKNANGKIDQDDAGLAGVTVTLHGGIPVQQFERTTDAQGRFSFGDIPTGTYNASYTSNSGWLVVGVTGDSTESIVIDESGKYADVRLPAVQHLFTKLNVRAQFDRETYQPGATVRMTVVISNTADHAISGVTERCGASFPGLPNLSGGAGWGELARGGPGATIPASSTRVFPISEPLPEAASRFGNVMAFCPLRAAGHPSFATVQVHATARVAGETGSARGLIFEDLNSNSQPDDGEHRAGVGLIVVDPDTGAVVARPVTNSQGGFAVSGVPAGVYDVWIAGPWKPRFFDSFSLSVNADAGSGEVWFAVVPSPNEIREPRLKASVVLEKAAYNSGDVVRAKLTVKNVGLGVAERVHGFAGFGSARLDVISWGELDFPDGARIEPGTTRVFDVVGEIANPDEAIVAFSGTLDWRNGNGRFFFAEFGVAVASVTKTFGDYRGFLYGDKNKNGKFEAGEELAGARISISGRRLGQAFTQLTGAKGEFDFAHVVTGRYSVSVSAPGGWLVDFFEVQVDEVDEQAEIRAVRPLSDVFTARMVFLDEAYKVGDTARLRITLTNQGQSAVEGVKALCNGVGNENSLNGDGEGWGPLRFNGEGVTVAPGATRTIDVTEAVPAAAAEWGYVSAFCVFIPQDDPLGAPGDGDTASIIGKTGKAEARLVHDPQGDGNFDDGVANLKVIVVHPSTGKPVAKVVTDAQGNFDVSGLPARHYELVLTGPWKFAEDEFSTIFLSSFEQGRDRRFYHVVPGPNQPDPFPDPVTPPAVPPATPPAPAPQASPAPAGLAFTGASVLGLIVASLALLGAGVGAVVFGRRRRAKES